MADSDTQPDSDKLQEMLRNTPNEDAGRKASNYTTAGSQASSKLNSNGISPVSLENTGVPGDKTFRGRSGNIGTLPNVDNRLANNDHANAALSLGNGSRARARKLAGNSSLGNLNPTASQVRAADQMRRAASDNAGPARRTDNYETAGKQAADKLYNNDSQRPLGGGSDSTNESFSGRDTAADDQEKMGRGRTAAQDAETDKLNEQFYKPSAVGDGANRGPKAKGIGKLKSFAQKHGKKLWFAGAAAGGGIFLIMALLLLLGSLLLPHFFQNLVAFTFANTARAYRQANNQVTSKKMLIDSADDTKFAQIKAKYGKLKSWVTFEKYRPAAIAHNMETTGRLDFEYTPRRNPFARARMTAVIINGERIPLTAQTRWGIPFSRYADNVRLAAAIDKALFKELKGTSVYSQVLRTAVGAKILDRIGYRAFYAWANKGKDYKGLTPKEADRQLLREFSERAKGGGVKATPATPAEERATEDTKKAAVDAMKDDVEADKMVDSGEQSAKVIETMNKSLQSTTLESITKNLSTVTAVAIPACMIMEGSVEQSGPIINARAEAAQREFLYLGSAAHQQEAGDTAAEAIGAVNRKINGDGGIARANASQISSGVNVNAAENTLSPYAGTLGDFSLMNVILGKLFGSGGNAVANKINAGLIPTCKVVASVGFGVVAGAGELVLGFFTGGADEAAARAGTQVLSRVITEYLRGFSARLFSKQTAKRFVVEGGAIAGATLLARMIVASYAGEFYNGISKNQALADEMYAGAEANNNEVSRTLGGRPLTSAESVEARAKSREDNAVANSEFSFTERYLALTNPNSLLTKVGYTIMGNANHTFFANILNSASGLFNPFAIGGMFSKLTPSVAAAGEVLDEISATRTNIGWSEKELEAIETKETYYDVLENDKILEDSGKLDKIQEKFGKCKDDSFGDLFARADIVREENGTPDPSQGDCSPENLGMKNKDFGDLVFRWRISTRKDAVMTIGNEIAEPTADVQQSL